MGSRPDPAIDLNDAEKRDLIALIQAGKPLPEKVRGWTNKLIWGDNKLILSSLKSGSLREQIEQAGGLKLIYIDPPFDVGADFSMDIEIGGETLHKEPTEDRAARLPAARPLHGGGDVIDIFGNDTP